jgi:predicted alpha/beta superfamily hydrolase
MPTVDLATTTPLVKRRFPAVPGALVAGLLLLARALSAQHAAAVPPPTDPVPVHETFTVESRAVGERRVINVYTPPGYERARRTAFPVLYMPDGGLAEDFPHVANTIDSLIARGAIRPVIVVGIENTERRRDLTGPTTVASDSAIAPRVGGSAAFRRFIRDELMPAVRSRYRCTDETAIVGESLAGLFVVETLLLEPTLFRRYIAISPSLWWNQDALVHSAPGRLDGLAGAARTLYLTAANEPGIAAESATLAETLEARAPKSLTWRYEPRPRLEHGTIFRAMAPEAFVATLK